MQPLRPPGHTHCYGDSEQCKALVSLQLQNEHTGFSHAVNHGNKIKKELHTVCFKYEITTLVYVLSHQ